MNFNILLASATHLPKHQFLYKLLCKLHMAKIIYACLILKALSCSPASAPGNFPPKHFPQYYLLNHERVSPLRGLHYGSIQHQ